MRAFAVTIAAFVATFIFALDRASADEADNCVLRVDGTTYIEGDCQFFDDGSRASIEPALGASNKHRARLHRQSDGSAVAWWNGPTAMLAANTELGSLKSRGRTCWVNERAQICFTPVGTPPVVGETLDDDEPNDEAGGPDFGTAFDTTDGSASMTCLFADEDILPASSRMMARGMSGPSYTGHIPRLRQFSFDGIDTVNFAGTLFTVLWKDDGKVAIPTLSRPSASALMPGLNEEQAADLQRGLDNMRAYQGSASGLDKRVIILDFDAHEAVVATISGNSLTERQPLRCQ